MAGETSITITGNLTADPELRFTASGSAVANFTIASTPRTYDRGAGEWKDGDTLFLRASVWREMAENVAESLTKGDRVIASGILKSRSYETREGEKRTVIELEVEDIGLSLRYNAAVAARGQGAELRAERQTAAGNPGQQNPGQQEHALQATGWQDHAPPTPGGQVPAGSDGAREYAQRADVWPHLNQAPELGR